MLREILPRAFLSRLSLGFEASTITLRMCIDGCGMLYDPGVPLENVSCKCGQGYWDVFAASFVPGEAVRKGKAPPRKEYEARKRRELSDEEFEARIRHQWIIHFLDCVVKTRWDQKAAREGRNDGTTRRRALTELDEIIRGDYKSRGTSQALFSPVPVASLVPGGSSSQRPLEMRPHAGNVSQDQAPLAKPSSSSQKLREGTAAARVQYQTLFLPAEDLSWDVLKYHWGKKTYGDWRSLQKHSLVRTCVQNR